ncbi:Protein MOR1 [Camellia lanceoleosa]|uniref:Protein MOR1 n=1 Tax=Camellia lanceoleosa TaxID=1840588 RepID=A0ACC0HL55_9ERIC|nr:Protein MOR1 [Camellia lanceoleosa]
MPQNDLMKYFKEDLHRRLLSTDFKKQIDGIEMLHKSGHNIEKVREKMRKLIKQIIHAFSAGKTFPYVLEGLRSRNNRTRIECVDLVGFLIDNHGAEIVGQLKSLQLVASLTAELDGEIRKAALNTLATGYKIFGEFCSYQDVDFIWSCLGSLSGDIDPPRYGSKEIFLYIIIGTAFDYLESALFKFTDGPFFLV